MQGSLVGNPVQGSPLVRISELHHNSENSKKAKMCPWVLGPWVKALSCIYTYIYSENSENSEKAKLCHDVFSSQG